MGAHLTGMSGPDVDHRDASGYFSSYLTGYASATSLELTEVPPVSSLSRAVGCDEVWRPKVLHAERRKQEALEAAKLQGSRQVARGKHRGSTDAVGERQWRPLAAAKVTAEAAVAQQPLNLQVLLKMGLKSAVSIMPHHTGGNSAERRRRFRF